MSERVPTRQRLAYAAPAFALAVVGIPVYVYLPKFYTDVVGVDIVVLGAILLAVRLFDAVTDPLFGLLSDRARTRFGRRRPFILLASLPLALALYLLFTPPVAAPSLVTVWFGVGIFAVFLFWTAVTVPYESLGVELSFDYDERTAILGLRDGLVIVGTVVAASSPALVGALLALPEDAAGERSRFLWLAMVYAPLLVALCALCAALVPEGRREVEAPHRAGLGLREMLRNRPFVILLSSYTVSALGSSLPATLILYYVEYVLRSDGASAFLILYFVTGIACLPGWIALSGRVGKKRTWVTATAINTGAFIGVFFLGAGDLVAYGALVALSGIGFGATLAIPSAMQADVIDYDELLTGRRREGQYVGVWSIAKKLAAALGVGLALPIVGAAGYQPNVQQTAETELALRTLYALVPSACNLLGLTIALFYPIDRDRHRAILEAIESRRGGGPWLDPLEPAPDLEPSTP